MATPARVLASPIAFFNLASVKEFGLYDLRSAAEWNEAHVDAAMLPVDPLADEDYADRREKVLVYGSVAGKDLISSPVLEKFLTDYLPKRNKTVREIVVSEEPFTSFASLYPFLIILPHLFLSAAICSSQMSVLKSLGIRYILNATVECQNCFEGKDIEYLRIVLVDEDHEDLTDAFERSFQFIEKARANKSSVLVHCAYGVSRSATLVVAYLMKTNRWPLSEALAYTRRMREVAKLNRGFMRQLALFEQQLGLAQK